jgi:carboxymethylenebutenolidase
MATQFLLLFRQSLKRSDHMNAFVQSEFDAISPKNSYDRRGFLVTSLSAGFAASVLPVGAQTITTSTDGLEAMEIKIPAQGGDIPGYCAAPATGTGFPLVLVVQEIFGVHEHIRDVCRRFAKQGYMAIAPELYARQGDVSKLTAIPEILPIVGKVPDAQVMADLDAAVAYAKKTGKANTDRLAVTGFCWGGRITWLYAAHNPNVKAGGAWYGRVAGATTELQPKNPIDLADKINGEVLGLYGAADPGIPNDTVEAMRVTLAAYGKFSNIVSYPDTPHAFHADYRPSYRKAAADDAWAKLTAHFAKHLKS